MRILGGYQNTKAKEDFALTPFLFSVWITGDVIKVYGIGISWGWWNCYIALGFNIPPNYKSFKELKSK